MLPPIRQGGVNQDVQSLNHNPDDDDDDEDYHHLVQQPLLQPPVAQQQGRQDLTAIEDRQEPEMEELMIPIQIINIYDIPYQPSSAELTCTYYTIIIMTLL